MTSPIRPDWVDFHCHLDLYPDHETLVTESDRSRVATLAVTTTPKAWRRNVELASTSRFVRVALGLHPQLIASRALELSMFLRLLSEAEYVGEVGLDASPRFYASFADQERVFTLILAACAEQGGKVLTIHSVRCVGKVLEHLERSLLPDRGRAVMHWFTGTAAEARRAAELGCYFSINSQMLRSAKALNTIRAMPTDRLLTETDGPFVMNHHRPARPRDVCETVRSLASILSVPELQAKEMILTNLRRLMQRPDSAAV